MIDRKQKIFLILFMVYTSIYIARINLTVANPQLIENGCLDAAQIGLMGSVFSTVYSVGRLFNGAVGDTTVPWKMIVTGLVIVGISNICISFFPPFAGMLFFWTANAFAQSMLWSSVLCVIAEIYDEKKAKQRTSVMVTSVAVGNILGIVINTYLITHFGEKYAFLVPGAITIILGFLTFAAVKKVPNTQKKEHCSMFKLLKKHDIVGMCFPAMFHGIMKENISLWMTVYIVSRYAVDLGTSSYYVLLIPVIGLIGRMAYPFLMRLCSDNEHGVSMIGFALCAVASFVLCIGKISILSAVSALGIIYMAVSVINTSILSIYPMQFVNSGNTASVSGIMDFATYFGAGISSVVYGVLIKNFGYLPMFVSWIVISVISMMIMLKFQKCQ